MRKSSTAAVNPATPIELTGRALEMISGGGADFGRTMGSHLAAMGGMSGMMASMGKAPGADMGTMLGTVGGMKEAMSMGDMP